MQIETYKDSLEEFKEILKFKYFITEKDLRKTTFPYNNVLQVKWGSKSIEARVSKVQNEFKNWVIDELPRLRNMSLVDVNYFIYTEVNTLTEEYPECFDDVGFYTKKMLAEYYLQGRLVVDGAPVCHTDLVKREREFLVKVQTYIDDRIEARARREEECLIEYQEAMQRYKDDARPVYVGYTFKNKDALLNAYRDITKPGTVADKMLEIRKYIDVEFSRGKGWEIKGLLKEDTLRRLPPDYPAPVLRR